MRTTLKDIAGEVGVTPQLVSFYLNNPGTQRVAKSTREKINDAVRKLNYQPNKVAQALIKGKTQAIGLILGGFTQRKRGCFVHELMNEAKKRGYHLIIAITNYDQAEERKALEYMLAQQVDGILYQLYLDPESSVYARLKKQHYPILMHVPQFQNDFNTIGHDPEALRVAIEKLISRGHKKVCYVGEHNNNFYLSYYYKYCKDMGIASCFIPSDCPENINNEMIKCESTAVIFSKNTAAQKYSSTFPDNKIDMVVPYVLPFEYISDSRIVGVIYHDFKARAAREIELMVEIIRNPDKRGACELLQSHFLDVEQWRKIYESQLNSAEFSPYLT